MYVLLAGLVLVCAGTIVDANPHGRIHTEIVTNIATHPWTVYLSGSDGNQCGGSIISSTFVLSYASCGTSAPITIVFGTQNLSDPLFTRTVTRKEDIFKTNRLLILRVFDIELGLTVQPIRLPKYLDIGCHSWLGYIGYMAGYSNGELLRMAYTKIVPAPKCFEHYEFKGILKMNSICGAGLRQLESDRCIGDIGAALTILEDDSVPTQIGILMQSDCESSYSVFAHLDSDLDWIYDTTDVAIRF